MKVLPFVSAGEVYLRQDGEVELVPLQFFRSGKHTIFRIGNTTYWFDENGKFDGPEVHASALTQEQNQKLQAALLESADKVGKRPEEAYFGEGSPGHAAEVAGWPKEKDVPQARPEEVVYRVGETGVVPKKPPLH